MQITFTNLRCTLFYLETFQQSFLHNFTLFKNSAFLKTGLNKNLWIGVN